MKTPMTAKQWKRLTPAARVEFMRHYKPTAADRAATRAWRRLVAIDEKRSAAQRAFARADKKLHALDKKADAAELVYNRAQARVHASDIRMFGRTIDGS